MEKTKKPVTKKPSKKVKKTAVKTTKTAITKTQNKNVIQTYLSGLNSNFQKNKGLYVRYLTITLIVVVIGVFAYFQRSWFVVAVVNGQPITTVEFYQNLKAQNGQTVLDDMIRNKLILQEATKKGINISDKDIDNKLGEIEKQVGGKDQLKSALEARNISQSDFRVQVKIQLIVEKLLEKDIAVTDKEVDDFIAKNPTDPNVTATGGPNKTAIKSQLRSQKLNQKYQSWYAALQKAAKIIRF